MKIIFNLAIGLLLLISCGDSAETRQSKAEEIRHQIDSLESVLYADPSASFDEASATRLMNAYVDFQSAMPKDSMSASYLFKAAELALHLSDYQKSLAYFREVYEEYPNFKNRPMALFFQGSIYDDQLNQDAKAGEIYKEFLNTFPDHPFANDVSILIKNLGKSDEDLLKEFESQQPEI